ncbi:MAG TPA: TonB-dependent receptor [Sphingobium sp.]|jgi:iron complex outermembrane receptor protein|uniref:TonB-dependent receptor n=1 Tax=unclassified Sphingobium TaxID=2611147 RepID=UPI000ED65E3E|nr:MULTISPECIES: TonB-dependent receptor [unclassified Sphingobium]WIW88797.1 TonB-dependent receptor [Sphingobium sp. V4]HAF41535.1 TonB-dependent receptor [Sphingobium sp.]
MIARFLLLASVASASLTIPAAHAQEATPQQAENDIVGGAIVVTARRRAEELQDVPLSVSVLNSEAIEQTGSYNIQRLTQLQPTLQFYSTNPRNSSINIRGIGAPLGLTNDGIEQGVGIYIDQVYYNRVAAATLDFVDIEQVEVLRGPQGTLYGKNTTAGAINITTRAPSFSYEGKAEISVGNLNFKQAKATVSGPITDRLAIRIGASVTDRQGTIYNVASNQHVNSQDFLGLKGSLLWKATDTLNITLAGDYNLQNPVCCAQIYAGYGSTQRAANRQYPALTASLGYQVPSTNPYDRLTDLDAQLKARNEMGGASLRAEWDLGGGTLTSVSAYRYWDWQPSNDRDFTGLDVTTRSQNPTQQKQWTQELRYAQEGETIDFVVGAFGFHQTIHTTGSQVQGADASAWLLNPTSSLSRNPAVLNGLTAENDIRLKNTSAALFGQLTWHVTDRLSLQPGLRLNYDKKKGSYDSVVTGTASNGTRQLVTFASTDPWIVAQRGVLAPQSFEASFSDWNLSYDFTAAYEFSDDVMGYATYSRAFKSGGINLNGVPLDAAGNPQLDVATVKPEKVNHFEIGLKTQFWDKRATLNLTGFWTEIEDYQAIVNNGQNSVLRGYLANADKVRVRGIEADFSIRPSDRVNAYVSGAYTDPKYRKFTNAPCPPELSGGNSGATPGAPGVPGAVSPAVCDISGQLLPGISKYSLSYGVEFNVPTALLGGEGQFYIGWDGSYRSTFSSNASRSVYMDIKGYSLNNLRLGFRNSDGLNVYGWVRNIFDQNYMEVLATTPGNTGLIAGQPGDPRTYGLTLKVDF